jgi:UDPglucose--hexose-1-phosphate uridylyltransferase
VRSRPARSSAATFRSERFATEILDPRRGFERERLELEVRWDPLTGQSARLLPEGTLQPPARLDVERMAEESRASCPFCGERVEAETPRFPPEVSREGRFRSGEALLFPNLVAYSKWSTVSIHSADRHLLPIDQLDEQLLGDNLATQVAFARVVLEHDPASAWISINANHLPPSGSSIFHAHLQGAAGTVPTTMQRLLAEVPAERFCDYVGSEREGGERQLGSTGRVDWLAAFAPIGPAEIRAFVFGAASPAELDDEVVRELALGLSRALGLYAQLGFQSFNLAVYGAPPGTPGYPLNLRLVARSYFGPLLRSDAMWSERLHWEAATDISPERLAAAGRPAFSQL